MKQILKRGWSNLVAMITVFAVSTWQATLAVVEDLRAGKFKEKNWHWHVPAAIALATIEVVATRNTFDGVHGIIKFGLLTFIGWCIIWFAEGLQAMWIGEVENKKASFERLKDVVMTTAVLATVIVLILMLT